jgi:hypothetical protein
MPRSPPFYDFLQFPGLNSAFYIGEPPFEKQSQTITVENLFEAGVMITDIVIPKELGSMFWVSVRPNYVLSSGGFCRSPVTHYTIPHALSSSENTVAPRVALDGQRKGAEMYRLLLDLRPTELTFLDSI